MTANRSASVLARLLNLARQRGDDYSLLLNRFTLERLAETVDLLHTLLWPASQVAISASGTNATWQARRLRWA